MTWRLRMLAEDIWLPGVCRLCARPTGGPALAVRGPRVDKPPALPQAYAELAHRLCPSCLAAYARPGGPGPQPTGLVAGTPPLLGWIGDYGADARRYIHELKYRGRAELAVLLGQLLAMTLDWPWQRPHVLVPVPLHPDRQRTRGFNQAALIAAAVRASLGWPVRHALERVRQTQIQAGLDRTGREANVAGAFRPKRMRRGAGWQQLAGARVLLVDDVCTTGATLAAAAAVCREAGAERVAAAVLFVAPAGDIDFHVENRRTTGGATRRVL